MEVLDLLKGASELVYKAVKDMAGTDEAGGDFGIGAGGDVSRNIDIIAEKTVIDYVKENGFDCTILGEECGRVEIGKEPKGFLIMDAIDGSTNAVRGVPFFCCSLAYATENKLSSVSAGIVQDLSNGDAYWALNGTPMHVYSGSGKCAFLNGTQCMCIWKPWRPRRDLNTRLSRDRAEF